MRRIIAPLLWSALLLAVAYAMLPFWNAIELKRAIRAGDVAMIEARVDWTALRQSLRTSLAAQAPVEARRRLAGVPLINRLVEKVAASYGGSLVDRMVDSYATPEGLVQLAGLRDRATGAKPDRTVLGIARELAQRVKSVAFTSLTRVEIVVADRHEASRHVLGALELRETGWKLTEVRFLNVADAGAGR